ncbi:hypothetical protein KR032_003931 [Drosophila birchii]|nr:hypothetical protein KR032_003931 [Drosophila birchii]
MSFTLTSQSVMRFERSSTRLGDEWQRTLMFFNVDISGGVHCDHRNEITASRTLLRNGKRELINEICKASTDSYSNTFPGRNPGGGLSNPIRECAMPFVKPNEFYAQSRDDSDLRGFIISHPGRREKSSYRKNDRHHHHRSAKPRCNNSDIASFSHFPTQNSTHRYITPDYETDNGFDEGYKNRGAHKSYPNDEYELPNQISRDLTYPEEARDSRDCYDIESSTDSSYENPHDYYTNERPKQESHRRSYEPPRYRNISPYFTEELSCKESLSQLNIFRPRGKNRQTSGSMLPEYALDYNKKRRKDNKKEDRYDRFKDSSESDYEDLQPPPESGKKIRYSPKNLFDYEDYAPKPRTKFIDDCRPIYKTHKEKGFPLNQCRKFKNMDLLDMLSRHSHEHRNRSKESGLRHRNRSRDSGSFHKNRYRRHSHIDKVPPYVSHYKKSAHNNRISKQNLSFTSPTMHEKIPKANGTVPRRAHEKRKFNLLLEDIPRPLKKIIKKEIPGTNFHSFLSLHDEIPRRHKNVVKEPSPIFGKNASSELYNHHKQKSSLKSSPGKKKLFDFGSEIPYKLWKCAVPTPMHFKYEVPTKNKTWSYHPKNVESDSSCSSDDPQSTNAAKTGKTSFRPRVSLYEVESNRPPKSIKQKISGFLKMSKKSLKRSNTFKDKMKRIKTQREYDEDNGKPRSNTNSKGSEPKASQRSQTTSTSVQNDFISAKPSIINKTKRCLSKIGTGSHYPTVFRGKPNANDENEEFSPLNFKYSTRSSKSDHNDHKLYDRISSGNCSLNNDVIRNDCVCASEISRCPNSQAPVSLPGSLKVKPSKEICSKCSNNDWSDSISNSSSISIALKAKMASNSSCQCSSSTLSSSKHSSIREVVHTKCHEPCTKPVMVCKSTSSEVASTCPRSRIAANWSLTQKSCMHLCNEHPLFSNSFRPGRPGLSLTDNIEMISRPPSLNVRSSLKKSKSKNTLPTPSNKKVCLKITSSSSCLSKISSENPCCNETRDSDNMGKSDCHKSPCIIGNMGEERQSEMIPKSCSWPGEKPCSVNPRPSASCCLPKVSYQCPDSSASECSRNLSITNSMCNRENMQLVCMNSSCPCCATNPNSGSTQSLSHPQCDETSVPMPGGSTVHWADESAGGKGIVENLKRELMNTFRRNRNLGSPCAGLQHAPHIMFFPCQRRPIISASRIYGPDSVFCWAACPRPPPPF